MLFNSYYADGIFGTPEENYEIFSSSIVLTAATANQLLVTAVAGFKVVVLSMSMFSGGAASSVSMRDGSAGAFKHLTFVPANTGANPNVIFPLNIAPGYFKTSSGVGLYADCGAIAVNLNYQYILVRA